MSIKEKAALEVRHRRATAGREDDFELPEPIPPLPSERTRHAEERRTGRRRVPRMRPPGKIRTGHEDHYVGERSMLRLGRRLLGARSMLSLDWLRVTDAFTPDLVGMTDQAPKLLIDVGGNAREWQADYAAEYSGGRRDLVIVRTVEWVNGVCRRSGTPRLRVVEAMVDAAAVAGWRLSLFTEDEIRVSPRLGNARLLLRHAGPWRPKLDELRAVDVLGRLPPSPTIGDLQACLGNGQDALITALRLDWNGFLEIDRTKPFSRRSRFTVRCGGRP